MTVGNLLVIGIGELQASKTPGDLLRTYALGSCVALILQHPYSGTAGLVHILLPDSVNQPGDSQKGPGHYADTAVPALIKTVLGTAGLYGQTGSGLLAKLVGGASMWIRHSLFHVGERNIAAVERLLQKHKIPLVARDTGGSVSRTVTVDVASGKVVVKWGNGQKEVYL